MSASWPITSLDSRSRWLVGETSTGRPPGASWAERSGQRARLARNGMIFFMAKGWTPAALNRVGVISLLRAEPPPIPRIRPIGLGGGLVFGPPTGIFRLMSLPRAFISLRPWIRRVSLGLCAGLLFG